jgi:uncharacterized protein (TIGR02453 family)
MKLVTDQRQHSGFSRISFEYLQGLQANNNRDWYNANKSTFKDHLEAPFAGVLEELTKRLEGSAFPMRGSKATMFRMNRDARFSKDKSPYKTSISGLLTQTGTKSENGVLIYLHLDLDGGFIASGAYQPSGPALYRIRQRIIESPDVFEAAVGTLKKAKLALDREHSLVRMPRDFITYDKHPLAWALKLKSLVVKDTLTKTAWTTGKVLERSEALVRASSPLLKILS